MNQIVSPKDTGVNAGGFGERDVGWDLGGGRSAAVGEAVTIGQSLIELG
jgi:hypothetical protein